jgi:hypothetical protein
MIEQYLPNNNETATITFRQNFYQLNSPQYGAEGRTPSVRDRLAERTRRKRNSTIKSSLLSAWFCSRPGTCCRSVAWYRRLGCSFLKMMIWLQPHEPSARVRRLTRSAPIMCRIPDGWWQCCSQATELITFQDQELTSLQSNKNWGSWIISALLRMQTLSENNLMY